MDEAKAIINIKEGVIELQGPVDFVRHYLSAYQPAIMGLQSLPKDTSVSPEKAKAPPRKRKEETSVAKAGKGTRGRCTGAIRSYLESGFFDEPHSTGEIKQRLSETGITCTDSAMRISLRRLAKSGSLVTTGRGRTLRYQRAG